MSSPYRFDAPGPGTWEMDAPHCPKPMFGMVAEVFQASLPAGVGEGCKRYGILLETLNLKFVNGFPYVQPKPVGAPAGGGKPPPRLLFRLVTALHPEIRRRMKTASTLFERRPWLDELKEWDDVVKPRSIARHREFAAVDPEPLDDHALADHLDAVFGYACEMGAQDHYFTASFAIPVADFLLQTSAWTGLDHAGLLELFRGSSDISGGDCDERRALVLALRDDEGAIALLRDLSHPHATLAALRAREGAVGEAARLFFDVHGNGTAHGISLTAPTINEDPTATLTALLRSAETPDRTTNGVENLEQEVRTRVPSEHRAAFDHLLADARKLYRLRDERHLYGVLPCLGPARRVILAAGERLATRAVLPDPELALFADHEDLAAALREETPLDVAELHERRRTYEALDARDIPLRLGPPEAEPPPLEWLPNEGARRAMAAMMTFMGHMDVHGDDAAPTAELSTIELQGLAVSRGVVEGTARLVERPEDLDKIQPGDVLVAATTTPAINVVLPLLGAIVTDRGGVLSHAAIVTREFGIPGVVGTRRATQEIKDGARVRVNGDDGVVEVLA